MLNPFKGLRLWRSIAIFLLGAIAGIYVYHNFFDGQGDSIHIGKYKIKSKTQVEGENNKAESETKGIFDFLFNSEEKEKEKD